MGNQWHSANFEVKWNQRITRTKSRKYLSLLGKRKNGLKQGILSTIFKKTDVYKTYHNHHEKKFSKYSF